MKSTTSLELLIKKAAIIRMLIFTHMHSEDMNSAFKINRNIKKMEKLLESKECSEINMYLDELQGNIDILKNMYGKYFGDSIPDYAIERNISNKNHLYNGTTYNGYQLMHGERHLLYYSLKKIMLKDSKFLTYADLFYAYVLIKNKLRKELVQVNERVGFDNFKIYEKRKLIFLKENSFYEKAIYNLAIHTSLMKRNYVNESRIAPKSDYLELKQAITKIDNAVHDPAFYDGINIELYFFDYKSGDKNKHIKEEIFYDKYLDRLLFWNSFYQNKRGV